MKKKTIAALAAGGALLLAAAVIGVLSLAKGYFILTPPTHIQLNGPSEERIAAFAAYTDPRALYRPSCAPAPSCCGAATAPIPPSPWKAG